MTMRITLFWRLLASDIHFGFRAIAGRLAIVFVTGVTLCVLLFVHTAGETPHIFSLGFADYYAALFAGIQEYHPQQGTPFKLPAGWLCMGALAAYVVLGYPTRDLNGIGMQTLAASGNRWFWWLSKCIWTLLACFAFWFVTLAACATVTIALGIPFTLKLSPELPDLLRFFAASDAAAFLEGQSVGMCILLIPLILGALCSIQLVLAFATTPLLGFSVTVAQLLVASFFLNPWLLGNYLMLARSNLVIANGVAVNNGALLSLAIIIASIVLGGHLFARRDILGRESDAS